MVSFGLVEFDLEKSDLEENSFLSVCLTSEIPIPISSQTKELQTKKIDGNFAFLSYYGRKYCWLIYCERKILLSSWQIQLISSSEQDSSVGCCERKILLNDCSNLVL